MEGPIRVVLADDHAAVRRSLRRVLDSEENIEVIAEAQDLDSLMREMHTQPSVLALTLSCRTRRASRRCDRYASMHPIPRS